MDNEGSSSTEPVLNNTPNETVSQACNNLNENTAGSPFSEVKSYKLENLKSLPCRELTPEQIDSNFPRNNITDSKMVDHWPMQTSKSKEYF